MINFYRQFIKIPNKHYDLKLMNLKIKQVTIRIPYEQIYSWEQHFLEGIQGDKMRLLEAKLDQRLTVITLCYLMTILAQSNEEEQQQQIIWLCQSEQRKEFLLAKAMRARSFLKHQNLNIANLRIRKSQVAEESNFQDKHFELKIRTIQQHLRNQIADLHVAMINHEKTIRGFSNFYEYNSCKMILVETTDVLGLSQCLFPYEVNQIYLRRAAMQIKRLDKYYHFNPNISISANQSDLSILPVNHQFNQQQHILFNKQLEQLFSHLYIQKRCLTVGMEPELQLTPDSRYMCDMMVNLQLVGYVIACFIKIINYDLREEQVIEFCMSLEQLEALILKQTCASSEQLLLMGRMIDDLLGWRPPWLPFDSIQLILQAGYIRQICRFVESVILWNRLIRSCFTKKTQSLMAIKLIQIQKPSIVLKIVVCDKSLPLHVLQTNSKSLVVVQAISLPQDYLREAIVQQFSYLPSNCHYFSRFALFGIIIAYNDSHSAQLLTSQEIALSLLDQNQSQDHILQKVQDQRVQILGYGSLLCDICDICPGGIIAYFPTRAVLQLCLMIWSFKNDIYSKIIQNRPTFIEQKQHQQNVKIGLQYRQNCKKGRGGLLLMSINSDMAKTEKFYEQTYCIVFLGLPWEGFKEYNLLSNFAELKIKQSRMKYALYRICQCLGNCINSWQSTKTVMLVDQRFDVEEVNKWLPFFFEETCSTSQALQRLVQIYQKASSLIRKKVEQEIQFQQGVINNQFKMDIE